jgi:hypothetical protein
MRKLIATVFNYSLDGFLADEGTEFWKFCFDLLESVSRRPGATRLSPERVRAHHGPHRLATSWSGGVSLCRSLTRLDLIDELQLSLFPYFAGEGTRLFDGVPGSPTDSTWSPAPPPATGSSSSSTAGTANPAAHSATPSPTAMTELGAAARRGHTVTGSNPVPATSLTSKNERGAQTLISCARGRTRCAFAPALPQYHAPVGD